MFGIGIFELVVIFIIALLVFGPDKLPEIARNLGKLTGDLKRASDTVRREFYNQLYTPSQEWNNRIEQETKNLMAVKQVSIEPSKSEQNEITSQHTKNDEPSATSSEPTSSNEHTTREGKSS